MKFNERLKELMDEKQLTYEDLAKNIGFSKAIVGFWVNGQRSPTMQALINLAKYFNISIDYLVGLEDEFSKKIDL